MANKNTPGKYYLSSLLNITPKNVDAFDESWSELTNQSPTLHSNNYLLNIFSTHANYVAEKHISKIFEYQAAKRSLSNDFLIKFLSNSTSNEESPQTEPNKDCTDTLKVTFKNLIKDHAFEFGLSSPAEEYLEKEIKNNRLTTLQWVNEVFLDNYNNSNIVSGILRVISHLKYLDIFPHGQTMALAALSHKDAEVRECGIRAFENWANTDSLKILQNTSCKEPWLEEYRLKVISDLHEELC